MRHRIAGRKLGRTTSHRWALLRNMATSLFRHERITTTVSKAKELRPFAEKLITLAKRETLHARRQVMRHVKDREVVARLFDTLAARYATRPGGYTRIVRTGHRRGDSAEMAIVELVDSSIEIAKPKQRAAAPKKARKPATTRRPTRRGTARKAALADVALAEETREEAEAAEAAEAEEVKEEAKEEAKEEPEAEAKETEAEDKKAKAKEKKAEAKEKKKKAAKPKKKAETKSEEAEPEKGEGEEKK